MNRLAQAGIWVEFGHIPIQVRGLATPMEPSGAMLESRSTVLFAFIVVVLLAAGLGPADDFARPSTIDVLPGGPGHSDLWEVVKVVVDDTFVAETLKDARAILEAGVAGQVTLEATTIYPNCPVVS